jgi:hypothetical protein
MDDPGIVKSETVRTKRKRRWLQFSLRSLLVFTLLCAFASAWLTNKVAQKRAEREAAEAFARLGSLVTYDYQRGPFEPAGPSGPQWLLNLLGEDLFQSSIEGAHFAGPDKDGNSWVGGGGDVTNDDLLHLNDLPNLKGLTLFWTRKITDTTAERLGRLRQLKSLSIWGTQIDDAGFAHVKGLIRLEHLSIGANHITDAGLANIRDLTRIEELDLWEDAVTDAGLVNIEPLTRLRSLSLQGQRLTDAALSHIRNLRELKKLSVRSDSIGDLGIENVRGLIHLESLSLLYSDMTDAALANLDGMANLTQLDLTGSFITDAGLEHLKRFVRLKTLTLNATKVTDAGVAGFQKELPKCQISYWHSDRRFAPK